MNTAATASLSAAPAWMRWRYAVPPEKGGWIWWLGPLAVGAGAAGAVTPALPALLVGAFAAFCIRQPSVQLLKTIRRGRGDAAPLVFWTVAYSVVLLGSSAYLWSAGLHRVVLLGFAAMPVFAWHLGLVWKGRDRHHLASDLLAAAALSLTGPAAYYAGGGETHAAAFWVWALPASQTSSSIVHMFLRLEWRALRDSPTPAARLRQGMLPVSLHLGAFLLAVAACYGGRSGWPVAAALLIPLIEGGVSVARPQIRATPVRLGMRQLAVSGAAMLLLAAGIRG